MADVIYSDRGGGNDGGQVGFYMVWFDEKLNYGL